MAEGEPLDIAVIGAGLGGAFAALLLGRAGHRVTVFEKRPDPRQASPGEGRAINLGISQRALDSLLDAGLGEAMAGLSTPMVGRLIHGSGGALDFRAYGERDGSPASLVLTPKDPVHAVQRPSLARVLVAAADRVPAVSFRFQSRVEAVDPVAGALEVVSSLEGDPSAVRAELIIGADGVFSTVRRTFRTATGFRESLDELAVGYKQLTIQPPVGAPEPLRPDVHHLWPRQGFILTALPNPDGSFTATLFAERRKLEALSTGETVRQFFGDHFADVMPLMPTLVEDYLARPVERLTTLSCAPWRLGKAVLLGDACHAFIPFSGQGANAALLDAVALAARLEGPETDVAAGLAVYERERKPETDAIAHLSSVMTPLILWLAEPLMSPAGAR